MSSPSDRELLNSSESGERAALEEFMRRHWGLAWRVALRTTGDPELAVEAAQDTFLLAWRDRGQLPESGSVAAWLHLTARRAAIQALRRTRRERGFLVRDLPDVPAADTIAALEEAIDVGAILSRLPPEQHEILSLIALGYTRDEVAAELGISAVRLRRQLRLARRTLADVLPRPVSRHRVPAKPWSPSTWYFGPAETEPPFPEAAMTTLYEGLDRLFTRLGPPPDELLQDGSHG